MGNQETVKVWDLAVRVFHWSLVLFFTIAYLTGEDGEELHAYAGYVVTALVLFRVVWGFVGSKHARFSDFICGPGAILAYLKSLTTGKPQHYYGHNPAGGLMVVFLLIFLFLSCWTGLVAYGKEGRGPLAQVEIGLIASAYADNDEHEAEENEAEEFWEEIHEFFSNFTLFLVAVHIAGVIVSSRLHGENLPRAMVTGRKTVKPESPH
ncbi:MAG: cytochrome b/b6 domain-containing protein [Pseudomonadota bacterium]